MEKYIGIMSGTSLDGVDVALCEVNHKECHLLAIHFVPFEESLKNQILKLIAKGATLKEIGEVDHRLALFFAKAVNELLAENLINPLDVEAIGLHGQTLWHEPLGQYPFSMQLGNASVLAVETGIDVVSDFRSKDVALGGQGAPLAPAFHAFLFAHLDRVAVVNIGGMANISLFEPKLLGYDTGCGNILMDIWVKEHLGVAYDKDGAWAKSGCVNEKLLNSMLNDPYFLLNYPKSTGREYFNKNFLRKYLEPLGKICAKDVQATLLALTVKSIADEIKKFNVKELLVCGGGARNIFLMEKLQEALSGVEVASTQKYNIDADNMEAMIFAWLAYKRVHQEKVDLKNVTGAKDNTILGAIYAKN